MCFSIFWGYTMRQIINVDSVIFLISLASYSLLSGCVSMCLCVFPFHIDIQTSKLAWFKCICCLSLLSQTFQIVIFSFKTTWQIASIPSTCLFKLRAQSESLYLCKCCTRQKIWHSIYHLLKMHYQLLKITFCKILTLLIMVQK